MQTFINPGEIKWAEIVRRPQINNTDLQNIVSGILRDVKQNGDEAVKKYSLYFDESESNDLKIEQHEIEEAFLLVKDELKDAIQLAKENIEKFHQSQIEEVKKIETSKGIICWRKSVAIEKVGLYIPGGTAPLFSTLLMLAIPAILAGCKEICICTPPDKNGRVSPVILYVTHLLGLKNIYRIGGVQAIAAM